MRKWLHMFIDSYNINNAIFYLLIYSVIFSIVYVVANTLIQDKDYSKQLISDINRYQDSLYEEGYKDGYTVGFEDKKHKKDMESYIDLKNRILDLEIENKMLKDEIELLRSNHTSSLSDEKKKELRSQLCGTMLLKMRNKKYPEEEE